MREIIFRGKVEKDGSWINICLDEDGFTMSQSGVSDNVILETVGQYTGMTDENGAKIFEGDIIRFDYSGKNRGVSGVAEVVFRNGKFGVIWGWHKEFVTLDGFANTTLTVLGNVHDNSELLDEGEAND